MSYRNPYNLRHSAKNQSPRGKSGRQSLGNTFSPGDFTNHLSRSHDLPRPGLRTISEFPYSRGDVSFISMSDSPSKAKVTDSRRSLSPPPSMSHVGDKHGARYGSAGDITSLSSRTSTEGNASADVESADRSSLQSEPDTTRRESQDTGADLETTSEGDVVIGQSSTTTGSDVMTGQSSAVITGNSSTTGSDVLTGQSSTTARSDVRYKRSATRTGSGVLTGQSSATTTGSDDVTSQSSATSAVSAVIQGRSSATTTGNGVSGQSSGTGSEIFTGQSSKTSSHLKMTGDVPPNTEEEGEPSEKSFEVQKEEEESGIVMETSEIDDTLTEVQGETEGMVESDFALETERRSSLRRGPSTTVEGEEELGVAMETKRKSSVRLDPSAIVHDIADEFEPRQTSSRLEGGESTLQAQERSSQAGLDDASESRGSMEMTVSEKDSILAGSRTTSAAAARSSLTNEKGESLVPIPIAQSTPHGRKFSMPVMTRKVDLQLEKRRASTGGSKMGVQTSGSSGLGKDFEKFVTSMKEEDEETDGKSTVPKTPSDVSRKVSERRVWKLQPQDSLTNYVLVSPSDHLRKKQAKNVMDSLGNSSSGLSQTGSVVGTSKLAMSSGRIAAKEQAKDQSSEKLTFSEDEKSEEAYEKDLDHARNDKGESRRLSSVADRIKQFEGQNVPKTGLSPSPSKPHRLVEEKVSEKRVTYESEDFQRATPSQLSQTWEDRSSTTSAGPGFGALSYTTHSDFLEMQSDRDQPSASYELDRSTPSKLLQKQTDREQIEAGRGPGLGAFSYTTPSTLLEMRFGRGQTSAHDDLDRSTPSEPLQKRRATVAGRLPAPGAFSYTAPPDLMAGQLMKRQTSVDDDLDWPAEQLQKRRATVAGPMLKRQTSADDDLDRPTEQLQKRRATVAGKLPAPGAFSYTASPDLMAGQLMKRQTSADDDLDRPPEELQKRRPTVAGKLPAPGAFSYTAPPDLMAGPVLKGRISADEELDRSTPSKLLQKRADREETERGRGPGLGAFSYTTPSGLLEMRSSGPQFAYPSEMDRSTPSELLQKREARERTEINTGPGLGAFSYTTPSKMFEMRKDEQQYAEPTAALPYMQQQDRRPSEAIEMDRSSPSKLLWKREQKELVDKGTGPGLGAFSYTTPSQMHAMTAEQAAHDEYEKQDERARKLSVPGQQGEGALVNQQGNIRRCMDEISAALRKTAHYLTSYSEPDFIKLCPEDLGKRASTRTMKDSDVSLPLVFRELQSMLSSTQNIFSEDSQVSYASLLNGYLADRSSSDVVADASSRRMSQTSDWTYSDRDLAQKLHGRVSSDVKELFDDSRASLASRPSGFMLTSNPSYTAYGGDIESDSDEESMQSEEYEDEEGSGSPDQGQRLYASMHSLEGKGEGRRKLPLSSGRSTTPEARSFLMDKEVMESQNRKLQVEISTLQTENKLMREKLNRANAKTNDLERLLKETQDELDTLQEKVTEEISEMTRRCQTEVMQTREQLQNKILALSKENETLKGEVSHLEKQLDSSHRTTDMSRYSYEKTRSMEAYKAEIASLREELNRVKALLDQSEKHLKEEEERHSESSQRVIRLTELKNLLQQQVDTAGGGSVGDKQLKSLEKRLKVTEERLHQERADRANSLSAVEEKLLSENARLQAVEKEMTRQLHREKDKNSNFEHRMKELRDENDKLRMAMPFDDSILTKKGSYDIPYSAHSSQRAQSLRITSDLNYIMSQVEKEEGLHMGQEHDIIRELWNQRELAYQKLKEWEVQITGLHITDHDNFVDGLKNLRDTYGQSESKLQKMEEQLQDAMSEKAAFDTAFKQQLSTLVQERHTAHANLRTTEDLLRAARAENESLRQSSQAVTVTNSGSIVSQEAHVESLKIDVQSLESKVAQLTRANKLLEGELNTAKVQLDARNKVLHDCQSELELAYSRMQGDDSDDRKQTKIDKLSAQMRGLQEELKLWNDKYNTLSSEKSRSDLEIAACKREINNLQKTNKQQRQGEVDNQAVQELREENEEKERRLESLHQQFDEVESQLAKSRQDLYIERQHTSELETEVESLQQTVQQRAQMFEALSGSEREQLAQYHILKDTLDSVNKEVSLGQARAHALELELGIQKDRNSELEREIQSLKRETGRTSPFKHTDSERSSPFKNIGGTSGDTVRLRELEIERGGLKQEILQCQQSIHAAEERAQEMQTQCKHLEEELVKEKSTVLQLQAEKGELEQHLEELAEEHDALIQEKTQAEDDLVKLEKKLREILQKYETDARKHHGNFETKYLSIPPEARKVASELDTLRLLLDGKEEEADLTQDKISRQKIEIDFLHRKVDVLHNDSISNREDVARLINELSLKMKELVSVREVNQFLVSDRVKLQDERTQLQKSVERERDMQNQRRSEMDSLIRKIDRSEEYQKSSEKEVQDKSNVIVTMETELRNANHRLAQAEVENTQLKNKIDHLNEDVKNLTAINATLEKRLEMEKNTLSEEKATASQWKEEVNSKGHNIELLQHEMSVLQNKLEAEQNSNEELKKKIQVQGESVIRLETELRELQHECDTTRGQLLMSQDQVRSLEQGKESIHREYETMCKLVSDKDSSLLEVRDRGDRELEDLKREMAHMRATLEREKSEASRERDLAKAEIESLNEELRNKEIQLTNFGRTLAELEDVTRQKVELESKVLRLEKNHSDARNLVEGQRKELATVNEKYAKQQENLSHLQSTNHMLQTDLRTQKEALERETEELRATIRELRSQTDGEKRYIQDNLTQAQAQLRSIEASHAQAADMRDKLQAKSRLLEQEVEDLKTKLSDESTGRRLMEQSVGSLRLQLEHLKNQKNTIEAKHVTTQNSVTRAESQLRLEKEKSIKLASRIKELEATSRNVGSSAKAKSDQVDMLQKEVDKLKQMLDSQKHSLTSKMKKATLDLKQQLDLVQEDRTKLTTEVQKLSTDLDQARAQIAIKNKENLKLQENMLTLEDQVRDCNAKLKQAQDTLKLEGEMQGKISARYAEQEEELKRLKNFLAKKAEESGEADKSMWHEMNKVILEMSRKMQTHLDSQRLGERDAKERESHLVSKYKKDIADLQSELNTEKSLHNITRSSHQALEEDNARLRHQLHAVKRRDSGSDNKKYKNRMEAINAIIARSQSQAQALLASGGYYDDNMNSPRRAGYFSPRVEFHTSPRKINEDDCNSEVSDTSFNSLAPLPIPSYNVQDSSRKEPSSSEQKT